MLEKVTDLIPSCVGHVVQDQPATLCYFGCDHYPVDLAKAPLSLSLQAQLALPSQVQQQVCLCTCVSV